MAFREVSVVQVKEALRRWLRGEGERPIAQGVGVDRKTARRYIAAAMELGVERSGGEEQLSDELIGQVVERVRPHRPDGHGEAWRMLLGEEERIKGWVKEDLTVTKIGILLARRGVVVPPRTLARFAVERCGAGRRTVTVRVDDPPPGPSSRSTSAASGSSPTGSGGASARADLHGLSSAATSSSGRRFSQTTEEVIRGFEAAWGYFGGVFPVVIPDNMKSIVITAENTARGSTTSSWSTRSPGASSSTPPGCAPRPTNRGSSGSCSTCSRTSSPERTSVDLADCRARAETWCSDHRRHAHPRHDAVPAPRGVPGRGAAAASRPARRALRHAQVVGPEGPP